MEFNKITVGEILSEASFYTVTEVTSNTLKVTNDFGQKLEIGKEYVEKVLNSASYYNKTIKVSGTEMAKIVLDNPRIAMTIIYLKADKKKTKKAYNLEVEARIQEILEANIQHLPIVTKKAFENPVLDYTPGEQRVIKGRHYGTVDTNGRLSFVDMKITTGMRDRLVDLRVGRLKSCIVNNTQYILK